MNAAGKTSPIFSFGTNIRYFIQSKGDVLATKHICSKIRKYIGMQET